MECLLSDELLEWVASPQKDEIDRLLTAALNSYEVELVADGTVSTTQNATSLLQRIATAVTSHSPALQHLAKNKCPFASPKTDEEVTRARSDGIPLNTQKDTKYCFGLWETWRVNRMEITNEIIPQLSEQGIGEIQHWLILEVRGKNGDEFPPNTLHHICFDRMENHQSTFFLIRASLDSEMKRLQQKGAGSQKKQAEILTEDEEEMLWSKGFLGDSSPQSLLDTMVFYNGLYFALHSGKEHRQFRSHPCQITII